MEKPHPNRLVAGGIVIGLIAAVAIGIAIVSGRDNDGATVAEDTHTTTPTTSSGAADQQSAAVEKTYKDGTYTAEGRYATPGGREAIVVKVTLAGGVISNAEVTQKPESPEAKTYQAAFVSGYRAEVVGKNIDSVSLSRVAGSSLTPDGFNNALTAIKSQAEA